MGLDTGGESDALPVDTVPSEKLTSGGDDPGSTVGLDGDSGGGLGADLTPALSVPSLGETVGVDGPDSVVSSDSNVEGLSGSLSPLDGLEGEASFVIGSSDGS